MNNWRQIFAISITRGDFCKTFRKGSKRLTCELVCIGPSTSQYQIYKEAPSLEIVYCGSKISDRLIGSGFELKERQDALDKFEIEKKLL
jgi:hypothetical protein